MIYEFDGQRKHAGHMNKTIGVVAALFLFGHIAGAIADDEIPTGFYAATQNACFGATGQLFSCRDGRCSFQEYQGTVATGDPVEADVTLNMHPRTDRNGFEYEAGDTILKYKQFGADVVRVVRPEGRTITTTYLARTDRNGAVTFAFLENGISKDPSVKPQLLSRCEAYDIGELEQILADGAPRVFPKIETMVPPGLPLTFTYTDQDNAENSGVLANIPILATAPREDAYIVEAVPVPGRNPDYPDIMVLWTVSPGTPTPIQFLSYDPVFHSYIDRTTALLASGSAPLVDNPGAVPVGTFVDGRPSVFIANGGIDAKPWTGSLDTLLVLNADFQWEDRSALLPRREGWSHDAALGRITTDGSEAIYVAKIDSTPGAGSQILRFGPNEVSEVSETAAPSGLAYTKAFFTATFADVNGDGADDLVMGNERAMLFLNSGDGEFGDTEGVKLPKSPLPNVYSPITKSENGPRYLSIEPIVGTEGGPVDLLAMSSPFYKGYAIQYLKNDGEGNFTDETETYVHGANMEYVSTSDAGYVWMRRVFAYEHDGVQDIIARSGSGDEVASQVFLNEGGKFQLALSVNGYTIENALQIEGKPVLLISNTQNLALMAYPE
ncbi:FG-GAP repeat domain-containing protein [uncultured Devosia sp.]|uniref:FG-GAP repeat domain-containing protein n=1 Tax=uncultured Devosia sp. TaxID=211434 RepID=UPI0035CC31E7